MGAYPIGIVGESFDNDDGTSRQAEIKQCSADERVTLQRDPQNKYDSNCVKVVSVRGVQIGNISRKDDWISERLDRGGFVEARILGIRKNPNRMRGVVLCVRTAEDDDWVQDDHNEPSSAAQASTGCSAVLAFAVPIVGLLVSALR